MPSTLTRRTAKSSVAKSSVAKSSVAKADADPAALSVVLERVGSWVRRAAPPSEFNSVSMTVLDYVARRGPQRVTDLVRRERISQPGMTSVVSRLAEAGLVERRADPLDGRAALVAVTDAGRAFLADRHAARAAALAEPISRLSPDQQRTLYAAIDSLDALSNSPIPTEEFPR